MSDAQVTPGRFPRPIECPECGETFDARGITPHRRMRHGIGPEAATELAGTLSRLAQVLERMDERLDRVEKEVARDEKDAPVQPSAPVDGEAHTLEHGLNDVLAEIARVKTETEREIAAWGGHPQTDEQKALEQTSFQKLGTLRRRQASLLFRLMEAKGEEGVDPPLAM
jgi:hypothetical protein